MMTRVMTVGAALACGAVLLAGCGNEGEGVDPASQVPTTNEVYSRAGVDRDTGVAISVTKDGVATLSITQDRAAVRAALVGKRLTLTCDRDGAGALSTTFTWPKQFSSTQATLATRSITNVTGCRLAGTGGAPAVTVSFASS